MAAPRRAVREVPRGLGSHARAFVRELSIVVVGALLISTLLRVLVAQIYDIPSVSMAPTLQVGDRLLVVRPGDVQRGQVVVFGDPGGWLDRPVAPRDPIMQLINRWGLHSGGRDQIVKRAIGLPGDTVQCCDAAGRIVVNGVGIDEPYLQGDRASDIDFRVEVPAAHIFVLGDNRRNSRDSRCHLTDPGTPAGAAAFVPLEALAGRGVAVVWPRAHWQSLDPPPMLGGIPAGRNPAREHPVIEAGPEARC